LRGLRKGRKLATVMAETMMEAEDQARDQPSYKTEAGKIRIRRITRKTILNRGVNRAIRYVK